jgi:UDP-GlcNAc:undecaprenyl-phosphate GlcNAc-1-phosphate transferase
VYVGGLQDRAGQGAVILLGAVIVHLLGLVDDVRPLGAVVKLFTNLGVALLVVLLGDVRIATMWGPAVSVVLTVGWFVVIINAFNFLDNMDGLSAGVAWICLAFFAVCGLMAHQVLVPALAGLFLGAIGGFWAFNFPPARIFMGDAGSLLVGYLLAVISIMTTYYESARGAPPYALAMPLVILAVPLYDFASVITIRLAEGRSPLQGDQRHFSHRLVERGLSRRLAVLTIYLATATTGLAATLLPGADLLQTITIAIMVLMVLAIIAILESPVRRQA